MDVKQEIRQVCDDVANLLIEKNRKYGNSALEPLRIFSKADLLEAIRVRMDDKLCRIKNEQSDEDEDVVKDLMGYLVLYMVARKRRQPAETKTLVFGKPIDEISDDELRRALACTLHSMYYTSSDVDKLRAQYDKRGLDYAAEVAVLLDMPDASRQNVDSALEKIHRLPKPPTATVCAAGRETEPGQELLDAFKRLPEDKLRKMAEHAFQSGDLLMAKAINAEIERRKKDEVPKNDMGEDKWKLPEQVPWDAPDWVHKLHTIQWNSAMIHNASTKALWEHLKTLDVNKNWAGASEIELELKRRGEWGKCSSAEKNVKEHMENMDKLTESAENVQRQLDIDKSVKETPTETLETEIIKAARMNDWSGLARLSKELKSRLDNERPSQGCGFDDASVLPTT